MSNRICAHWVLQNVSGGRQLGLEFAVGAKRCYSVGAQLRRNRA